MIDGKIGSSSVTLELTAPRSATAVHVYAASWQSSGAPPAPVAYAIDYSTDAGKTWLPIIKDWKIERRQPEPKDFWSQSFAWGDTELKNAAPAAPVRVRFTNAGNKAYRKVEAYLAYDVKDQSPTEVTFAWKTSGDQKTATHTYPATTNAPDATWHLDPGQKVETLWVETKTK